MPYFANSCSYERVSAFMRIKTANEEYFSPRTTAEDMVRAAYSASSASSSA